MDRDRSTPRRNHVHHHQGDRRSGGDQRRAPGLTRARAGGRRPEHAHARAAGLLQRRLSSHGQHITCTLGFEDPDILDEPSGIVCGSTELLYSQSRSVVGKRFYDSDGNLVRRHFREYMAGTFTNPETGLIVLWAQHDTVLHDLAVPGDVATGNIQFSGLVTRAWRPSGGTVLTDSGRLLVDASTDEVVAASAHHPFDAYFREGDTAALAPLCSALD